LKIGLEPWIRSLFWEKFNFLFKTIPIQLPMILAMISIVNINNDIIKKFRDESGFLTKKGEEYYDNLEPSPVSIVKGNVIIFFDILDVYKDSIYLIIMRHSPLYLIILALTICGPIGNSHRALRLNKISYGFKHSFLIMFGFTSTKEEKNFKNKATRMVCMYEN
jgi:hypothetical protein